MADTKNKSNFFPTLEKLNKQAEFINTNEQNSILDIDVLLDYLRQSYAECMSMREKMENEKKRLAAKNQYSTLSLFNDQDFEETAPAPKTEPAPDPEPEPKHVTTSTEQNSAVAAADKKHIEAPKPDQTIDKKAAAATLSATVAVATKYKTQPTVEKEEPKPQPAIKENVNVKVEATEPLPAAEATPTEPSPAVEEDIMPDADDILDLEKAETKETPAADPHASEHFNDIDLDEIEFDEYEEEEDNAAAQAPTRESAPHANAAMPPAYWGDEIDTENPITAKKAMSLGETYKQERPSINDMLANYQKNNIIGQKIPTSANLLDSMNMNDKFTFTKELFHNNNALFQESIERLDSIKSLKDVLLCLDNMKKEHRWNDNNASVLRLQELIYAKFGH